MKMQTKEYTLLPRLQNPLNVLVNNRKLLGVFFFKQIYIKTYMMLIKIPTFFRLNCAAL